ncbi:urate oxidase [Cryobacterium flavum]|uniref:Uricase n=1 Tax=Cryobacterium flavum TaxID=1424659 RepID=A0A4R8UXW2_9MICO|nr:MULTISPECIES: urate oxidase [Cryobacterium]TFB73054.1 urate oxidase [Cryobacterium flavum]SDN01807.1 urate oxidase [Cryobacterium flavum]
MSIVLGSNRYGKAENRIVRIYRDTPRHEIHDVSVSTALHGDFAAAHLVGDQLHVLPTNTQKQTAYSFAKEKGLLSIESYGIDLATHFVDHIEPVAGARIEIEEFAWERVVVDGAEHNHTWMRRGQKTRTAAISVEGTGPAQQVWVVGGLKDQVILKSTGSEFAGFMQDPYTLLQPTNDRVMATSLTAGWRFMTTDVDWEAIYAGIKQILMTQFALVHSLALQQTLYRMGEAVLEAYPLIAEIRLSAPNKHHFLYDLSPFNVANNDEVYHAADRPYGLIQATITHDDASDAGPAWDSYAGLV